MRKNILDRDIVLDDLPAGQENIAVLPLRVQSDRRVMDKVVLAHETAQAARARYGR